MPMPPVAVQRLSWLAGMRLPARDEDYCWCRPAGAAGDAEVIGGTRARLASAAADGDASAGGDGDGTGADCNAGGMSAL